MKDHNTDVTAYSSDNCAAVKGERVVVLQKNEVVIRRVLCESRCWRRGVLRMGWNALVRNASPQRMNWKERLHTTARTNHRVRKMTGQSTSIRLYAVWLAKRNTPQSLITNSPVLYEILGGLSALEG